MALLLLIYSIKAVPACLIRTGHRYRVPALLAGSFIPFREFDRPYQGPLQCDGVGSAAGASCGYYFAILVQRQEKSRDKTHSLHSLCILER
jgi:hypothetical protein